MARCRALVLLFVLLLLAACQRVEPPVEPSVPDWISYETAADALPTGPDHRVTGSVPGTADQPVLYVGSTTEPGEPERATVWLPAKGKAPGEPVQFELPGDSRVEGVGTNDTTTVAVGQQWRDGQESPFVMVSKDRRSWEPLPITLDLAQRSVVLQRAAVTETGVGIAVGMDLDRDIAIAINLDDQKIVDLPRPFGMVPQSVRAVVRVDERLLALVRMTAEDGSTAVVGYQSTANGSSWAVSGPLPGVDVEVAGATVSLYGVVATGSARASSGLDRPAVWRWSDGFGWEADAPDVDLPSDRDARLGAPVRVDDFVVIPVMSADTTRTPLLVWAWSNSGASWFWPNSLPAWDAPDPDVRLEREGDRVRVVRSGWGQLEVGQFDLEELEWRRLARAETTFTPVEDWSLVGLDGDRPLLVGTRQRLEIQDKGWSIAPSETPYGIESGSLDRTAWDPKQSEDVSSRLMKTGADGTTVLLGVEEVGEKKGWLDVRGWVRSPGGDWEKATGLAGPKAEQLSSLVAVAEGWVAIGFESDDLFADHRAETIVVWQSTDGKEWERVDAPKMAKGLAQMRPVSVCTAGAATVILGWGRTTDGPEVPLVIRGEDDTWTRLKPEGLDRVTRLTDCASDGNTLLVRSRGATSGLWRSVDGGESFDEVSTGATHDRVGTVIAVDGGFLAGGERGGNGRADPVVWLSADGLAWTPVGLAGATRQQVSQLLVHGDQLVVATVGASGPGVAVLTNWAELLAQL